MSPAYVHLQSPCLASYYVSSAFLLFNFSISIKQFTLCITKSFFGTRYFHFFVTCLKLSHKSSLIWQKDKNYFQHCKQNKLKLGIIIWNFLPKLIKAYVSKPNSNQGESVQGLVLGILFFFSFFHVPVFQIQLKTFKRTNVPYWSTSLC